MERLNPIPARSVWFTAAPVPAAGLTSGLTAVTPAGGRDAKHRPAVAGLLPQRAVRAAPAPTPDSDPDPEDRVDSWVGALGSADAGQVGRAVKGLLATVRNAPHQVPQVDRALGTRGRRGLQQLHAIARMDRSEAAVGALKLMAYLAWVHPARATSIHRLLAGRSPGGLPGLAQRMVLDPALCVAACLLLQGLAHGNEGRTAEIHAALMAQDRMGLGAVARLLAGTDAQGQRQASGLLAKEA